MKNIAISLDDETYRRARLKAAELDTSASARLCQFLADRAGDYLTRYQIHDRRG